LTVSFMLDTFDPPKVFIGLVAIRSRRQRICNRYLGSR
jgi:hypothetical protein